MEQRNSCDSCRHRKLKCSKEKICSLCIKLGKRCVYTPRKKRQPITKNYVVNLEKRVQELENQIRPQRQGIDNDNLLENVQDEKKNQKLQESSELEGLYNIDTLKWCENDIISNTRFEPEAQCSGVVDGMGALSLDHRGQSFSKTFYGSTSSHGLLKFLKTPESKIYQHPPYYSPLMNANTELNSRYQSILDSENHRNSFFDAYFDVYHKCYPFLNESNVRLQYHQNKSMTDSDKLTFEGIIYQVFLNTILAIGSMMKMGESSIIHLLYYQRVKLHLQSCDIAECGSYQLLEAYVLLGTYAQKINKPNTGWIYHGNAVRMALSFGLHKEIYFDTKYARESLDITETRKRLWWSLFYFDMNHGITFGRPLHLPVLETIDIKYPLNIEDYETTNKEVLYPTIYSGLIQEAKLAKICYLVHNSLQTQSFSSGQVHLKFEKYIELNSIIDNFRENNPKYFDENDEVVKECLLKICPKQWFEVSLAKTGEIPNWFELTRRRMIWRYKNLQMLMFRSFIWYDLAEETVSQEDCNYKLCINICYNAATYTIDSISNFTFNCEIDTLSSWYAVFFNFQSVLLLVLLLLRELKLNTDSEIKNTIMNYIEKSKNSLKNLHKFNSLALDLVDTIDILIKPFVNTDNGDSTTETDVNLFMNDSELYNLDHLPSTAMLLFSNIGFNEYDYMHSNNDDV